MAEDPLSAARRLAGGLLADRGYAAESDIVLRGDGDDFAEVRLAQALIDRLRAQEMPIADVLAFYADEHFWDEAHGPSEAEDDRGAMARVALARHRAQR